jgi:twitching motility protein PilT
MTELLRIVVERGASDLLLAAGAPPILRESGDLESADSRSLTPQALAALCQQVLSPDQAGLLQRNKDVDFSLAVPGLGRFRFNVHLQQGSHAAAVRYIPDAIPDLDDLGLPAIVCELTELKHGLVLVTGQTGSGKTTTLAAMIERINRLHAKHIITLEDPIEYRFSHAKSLVEQREVGIDCPSFASGLKHVLRQDPDVILVGELRDLETIRTALQAAETGHLVLATLHSSSAAGTIDRIIEVFPAGEQAQIRSHLAECLRAVCAQNLVPAAKGRVAAVEVLVATRAVRTSIREGTTHLIEGLLSTNRRSGMQTMEQALKELVVSGKIGLETADEYMRESELCGVGA